jgi:hypothetical protein
MELRTVTCELKDDRARLTGCFDPDSESAGCIEAGGRSCQGFIAFVPRVRHLAKSSECNEFLHSLRQLLVTVNVVPSSLIIVTLMMEALSSSETSVLTRATRRNIPEDDILHSDRCEHLISHIALIGWTL